MRILVQFPWLTRRVRVEVRRDLRCLWWMGGSVGHGAPVTVAWSGGENEAAQARELVRTLREWGYLSAGVAPAIARKEN